ncbi:MAG TPA: PAS domain-containing protein [Rubrobacter sp.]
MGLPNVLRRFERAVAGSVLAGLLFRALRSLGPSRREDERFRLQADNVRDLVFRYRFRPKPGFEYVSPSSTAITGYTPEEHYADPDLGIKRVHPEDRHMMETSMRAPEEPLVLRWYRKDGGMIWTEQRNRPIYDEAGNVIAIEGIVRDITERKLAEEALRESEARFRLLAEKTSDLVCLHEPDGRYLYISPSCRRLLGYEPEELLGTDPYDLFHPEDLKRIRSEAHEKALDGQGAVSVTYRIRKASGEYTWFETLTEPILDENGEVVRLQTASRDVSERKRAEELLAEAARARAEFLAEVSHELRTPLTVIRGNAEVGLDLDQDCEHEEILREIVTASSTMTRMVEDLLFLARSESAAPPFRMEPVEAKVLLRGLARRAEALAAEHDATVDIAFSASGLVRVDPVRVEQAILALVDNAVKYGPDGQRVTLRSVSSGGELRVEVGDQGPGIPEVELPHVFERFYRLAGVEEAGSGLGLSIAQTIVEAHGGRIEAESQPGEGTRMSLILPLLPDEAPVR